MQPADDAHERNGQTLTSLVERQKDLMDRAGFQFRWMVNTNLELQWLHDSVRHRLDSMGQLSQVALRAVNRMERYRFDVAADERTQPAATALGEAARRPATGTP